MVAATSIVTSTAAATARRLRVLHRAFARRSCVSASEGGASRETANAMANALLVRLFPVPREPLPPRVEHHVVSAASTVGEYLSSHVDGVDDVSARELLDIGAVWMAPAPPPRSTRGVPRSERARRLSVNEVAMALEVGNYLRIHVSPKRFPMAYDVDWRECILANSDSFVVAHKPASVSVVPTVDNVRESCLAMLERELGIETGTLKPIHRLDVGTEGVLVLGKTSAFAKEFGDMLAKRECTKVYRVLTTNEVPLGLHIHDCVPADSGPRRMVMTLVEEYDEAEELSKLGVRDAGERGGESGPQRCVLRVLECVPITVVNNEQQYETKVELLTGRTHQIRGQFAALGAPLVGETLYRAPSDSNSDDNVRIQTPDERLGLQAAELRVHVDSSLGKAGTIFKAHDPWWVRER